MNNKKIKSQKLLHNNKIKKKLMKKIKISIKSTSQYKKINLKLLLMIQMLKNLRI